MDPTYGQRYRELYIRHWWWRARERVVLSHLDRVRPAGGWRRALDVGCGDGLLFPALRVYAAIVEGIEPDAALVTRTAREDGTIHVRPFDATFVPGHAFDLVLFLDVLEHLDDPGAAVAHAASLMEPGGILLVTVPAFRHLWTTHDDINHHVTRYTRTEMVALLSPHFAVEQARYFFRWVHPAKLAQRAIEAVRRPQPAPPEIPPAPLNAAMYALSRLEEALVGWSRVPVGSSLLAMGRRSWGASRGRLMS
ncbi:MAG: class I SAM-dependent methyltransferase [Longimicrobiales bacterium]|nr:class I SAM-dependent methyltransferase [Longimicrobiales bacterium]